MSPASLDDRVWLERRYTVEQATVAEIAGQVGRDTANVWRALRRLQIPLRGATDRHMWESVLTADYLTGALESGMSRTAIAAEVGCHITTVTEWIAVHQLSDGMTAGDRRQLLRWYERDGLTIREIAERLGVHPRTARRRLLEAGVTLRPPGRRA